MAPEVVDFGSKLELLVALTALEMVLDSLRPRFVILSVCALENELTVCLRNIKLKNKLFGAFFDQFDCVKIEVQEPSQFFPIVEFENSGFKRDLARVPEGEPAWICFLEGARLGLGEGRILLHDDTGGVCWVEDCSEGLTLLLLLEWFLRLLLDHSLR